PQIMFYPHQQNQAYWYNTEEPISFSDVKIRHAFIQKVYSIVSLQLLITVTITALFVFLEPVKISFYSNIWILWIALGGTLVILIVLVCCESVSRKFPINIILLMIFTVFESILIGAISAVFNINTIFIALGITSVVVIALTIFAFQTKIDFTGFGVYLFVFGIVLCAFGIVTLIYRSQILNILYAASGAGLFSFYLIFDTQLMLGGHHKNSISPEDYVFGALNIYVDIINLFLFILRLVSAIEE
ncbi:lifeguard 1-like, partial [Brachionus plicatilis]